MSKAVDGNPTFPVAVFGLTGGGSSGGGGGGTGTVTSVAATVPSILAVAGSPITTSGTLAFTLATQAANLAFAGPTSGGAATPTFRALVAADIPDLSGTYQPLDADLTAIAALATTSFGRGLLTSADASALRTTAGLGTAATSNTTAFDAAGAAAAAQAASQPLDADLTALAALAATAGMLSRTGAGAFAVRTITGTASQITVTNGDGASGDPTLSLPAAVSTGTLALAQGTISAAATALSTTSTWNNSGVTFTGTFVNITNTASAAASVVADWQIGGVSKMSLRIDGRLIMPGVALLGDPRISTNNSGIAFGFDTSGKNLNIGNGSGGTTNFGTVTIIDGKSTAIALFSGDTAASLLTLTRGTITTAVQVIDSTVTWNAAVTFTGWKLNVTSTSSNAGSLLLDLQVGGTSQFSVGKAGVVTLVDAATIVGGTSTGTKIGTGTTQKFGFWNATPVVQPASANQAALTNSTTGSYDGTLADVGVVFSQSTINNNFTDVFTLLDAMRTAMVNAGLMKGAA